MPDWRELRVQGLGPIGRVVAVFQVGPPLERVPVPSFKVKVVERANGSFLAVLNLLPLGPDGNPSAEAGLGATIEDALEDALRRFVRQLDERGPGSEASFVWADPEDF